MLCSLKVGEQRFGPSMCTEQDVWQAININYTKQGH